MLTRGKLAMFIPYIYYLTPFLTYETTPLAVLTATLICFGLLSRNQEITAFRACGISVYRLAAPVLLAALCFGGALFAMDYYYLPGANRVQDQIRDEIKGRPPRTFLRPDRQWTYGLRNRIFYHRFFDIDNNELAPIEVFDLGVEPFRLTRHISAESAKWDPLLETWVFRNGWIRDIDGSQVTRFEQFETQEFSDILETPDYFRKENKSHQQMNWRELQAYIDDLTQSGFATAGLNVLWYRKFSFPFFAFSMTLLAVPFAMLTGHRGALAPVAFSLVLAISFYAMSELFETLGQANQMSPLLAAWAPGLIFGLSGIYLFLRVRS
jgi:LPS export ABC transporter permease LptG